MPPSKHAVLSASGAHRWLHCNPSARLELEFADRETEAAAEGTAAHALAEHKLKKALKIRSRKPVNPYDCDEMDAHTDGYVEFVLEQLEEAKTLCADPLILIEQRLDFSCYVPDGFGTGDCLIVADKLLHIIDFKYGQGVLVDAEENPQMMLYALGALRQFDHLYDITQVAMSIYQPRRENVSTWTITVEQLMDWAEHTLKPKAEMAYQGEGDYHPIREFIESLPEWDKVPRVDTLLVDYLGAGDTAYVRAVTRKTLCAAISRVLRPGCKFDSMLVLNGPQGVGKSTLIAKLAGEWFSDSLNLGDTKDKTAAEKLQGYWILEIGELAGLKKAEVETLRSFLSRQNDIYRAAFGKRATPHLRQCVFFGTTNAESGYLRDTTGNRRFWPVKTPGNGKKQSWNLTHEEILQIWAEALVYVRQGEKLYLSAEIDALAKDEQREAMESDEREGLVREYLDTLLPERWAEMDLFERRNFLTGSDFGGLQEKGTVKRTSVSNMEIWCECFGKERANLRRTDSNELTGILARLGWKRADNKIRIPLYGPQYVFVPKGCSK